MVLPLLIFGLSFFAFKDKSSDYLLILRNVGFMLLVLTALTVHMSIKNRSFLNPFRHYFGLGDLLFFIAIAPLFLVRNYMLFFILSMLFSIVLQRMTQKKETTVPLAGFASLLLILLVIKDTLTNFGKITIL